MLSFLAPVFLAGAAAAAIPIVLHLLKREPETRVQFAAVKLLRKAPVEHTQRRHLRELILLALRIVALVLLALAFARPFFASGAASTTTGVVVVALDTSYSMSAPGRFERAKQLARDAVARAPAGDLVGVVTFDDAAQIVMRPGSDRVLAASAINEAATGYGATRYRAALSASAQHLAGRRGTIVVVTDLQENGWDAGDRASVPDGTTIEVADVGEPPANLAVTAVRPLVDRIVASVHNASATARDAKLHLTIDGRPAGDATVPLGPNQSGDAIFAGAPRGTTAEVRVDDPGGIAADNVRYALVGGLSRPSVLVVTGSGDMTREAFYVQHALAAGTAGNAAFQVTGVSGAQLSSLSDDRLAPHAAVFLLSTRGLERRGRELLSAYARTGGGLLIAAGADVDGDIVADVLGSGSTLRISNNDASRAVTRTLAPADVRHPIFQAFAGNASTLGLVRFERASRIAGGGCQTLARFTTGDVAFLECPAGDGRALVLAADLDNKWSDFPLHATFVPFLHEIVGYLASARAHASDYVIADAPAGVKKVPGVATVSTGGPGVAPRQIAVNVDPRESDPSRISADEFQSAVTRLKDLGNAEARVEARQQEDRQHLWQYAMALMVILLAAEGALAARTA
ncbi:MAG TPA: BatA domain-containing protein [Vicinamibacterales bacterium]|nr:BatA domain-containing protein [Vicinamibacterales bacterium]